MAQTRTNWEESTIKTLLLEGSTLYVIISGHFVIYKSYIIEDKFQMKETVDDVCNVLFIYLLCMFKPVHSGIFKHAITLSYEYRKRVNNICAKYV